MLEELMYCSLLSPPTHIFTFQTVFFGFVFGDSYSFIVKYCQFANFINNGKYSAFQFQVCCYALLI